MRKLATAESLASLFGLAFIVGGVLGFVPGVVQDYGELKWWKPGSGADLFGVFQTSILHNLLSIGVGVIGLVAARRPTRRGRSSPAPASSSSRSGSTGC